ncbi:MAG: restriction endonuclease subunit S, partial [Limosilactobacillus reuteri]|nr:restriction endonuclease subunit S [Limosilactobacillus reuteri]
AGSTFVEVSGKEMAKMPIKMPYYKEQQHISSFFSKLDFLITLHQRKPKINKKESKNEFKFYKRKFIQRLFLLLD